MTTRTRTDESSAPGARLLLAFELSQRVWKLGFTLAEKMAVFTPMPSASAATAVAVNSGLRRSDRRA